MNRQDRTIKFNGRSETYHVIHDCTSYDELCSFVSSSISSVSGIHAVGSESITERLEREAVNSILSADETNFQDCVSVSLPKCLVTIYATGEIIFSWDS